MLWGLKNLGFKSSKILMPKKIREKKTNSLKKY